MPLVTMHIVCTPSMEHGGSTLCFKGLAYGLWWWCPRCVTRAWPTGCGGVQFRMVCCSMASLIHVGCSPPSTVSLLTHVCADMLCVWTPPPPPSPLCSPLSLSLFFVFLFYRPWGVSSRVGSAARGAATGQSNTNHIIKSRWRENWIRDVF